MARTRSGAIVVDNLDRCVVVFPKNHGLVLREAEVLQDATEVFGDLGSSVGGYQFRLACVLSSDGLALAAINDETSTHGRAVAGGGSHVGGCVSVSCIDVEDYFGVGGRHWHSWQRCVGNDKIVWHIRKVCEGLRSPINDSPLDGAPQVDGKTFEYRAGALENFASVTTA